jgi:hypothetical protein
VSGTSTVGQVIAYALVKGSITVEDGANVTELNVEQFSSSYAPTVKVSAGANITTLQLNNIAKTSKITIDDGANISKIIHKGVEYSSIADFKSSL